MTRLVSARCRSVQDGLISGLAFRRDFFQIIPFCANQFLHTPSSWAHIDDLILWKSLSSPVVPRISSRIVEGLNDAVAALLDLSG